MATPLKRVYFVRHGKSISNTQKLIAASEPDHLSDEGLQQAEQVAGRLAKVAPEVVLSSHLARAERTASLIAQATGAPHESHESLQEMTVPSELVGCGRDGEEVQAYFRDRSINSGNPTWRYSDEENYDDLITRTLSMLRMLEGREEATVVVVTHAMVFRALIGCVLFGEECNGRYMDRYGNGVKTANTGITECQFEQKSDGSSRWALVSWNDRAHL